MFFDALGSLPLGTAPVPVAVAPPIPPSGGGAASTGGSLWDDRFKPRALPRKRELTEAELMAILLAADEEFFN